MSSNRELLRTTSLKGLSPARSGGPNSVEAYAWIIDRIRNQCGADVGTLFAEPARPSNPEPDNPQLTWYSSLDGQVIELASLDEMARRPVVGRLRDRLQRLKPILEDPEIGATVASWLYIPSTSDLLSVAGNPVLINWGYVPDDVAASATKREKHYAETIGRFAADMSAPPFTPQEAASYSSRVVKQPAEQSSIPAASQAADSAPPSNSGIERGPPRFADKASLIASLIAAAVLAFLLVPGVLVFPRQTPREDIERHASLLREDNKGLAERLRELESAAKERVCRLPNGQLTPLPAVPGLMLPPGTAAPSTQNPNLLPPPPERIQIPPNPNAPAGAPTSLVELADQAAVFIFGALSDGVGTGSGFFVTKDRVVTNRHVVEKLAPGSIKVTNKALGRALSAKVIASSPPDPSETGRVQDFAILAVEPEAKAILKLGPTPGKGSAVMAAGYPGFITRDDAAFKRLMRGDLSAAPDSSVQQGAVIQKRDSDPVKLVTHSANLGRGNSGGPLMDLCGRVIGVNTSVKNEGLLATTANLAQDVSELRAFLSANGVTPEVDEAQIQCPAAVAAAPPSTSAPLAAPAQTPPAARQ